MSLVEMPLRSPDWHAEKKSTAPALNLRDHILPAVPGQQEFTKSFLSGSQAKTAFALRLNAETMIREDGLNSTGFLTLTCGDYFCTIHGKQIPNERNFCPCCMDGKKMTFVRVSDSKEAARRFDNLNRRVLSAMFTRAIAVTERHKSKDIHFHLLGTLAGKPDIRTGLNFEEIIQRKNYRSASEELRGIWAMLRDVLPRYGFGRAELLPVRKTGEAVACYVSKYIEKNVFNRLPEDRGKKLVRYLGWEKMQLKANEFEWDGERARAWRGKSREMLSLVGVNLPDKEFEPLPHVRRSCASAAGKIRPKFLDGTEAREILGSRWAFHLHNFIQKVSDQAVPFMVWDYLQMGIVRDELAALAGARHIRNFEREKSILMCGEIYSATEIRNLGLNYSRN
jgi:hypothetical protein